MMNANEIALERIDRISYWACFARVEEIEVELARIGVRILGTPQKDMHMTLRYFGYGRKKVPERVFYIRPSLIGREVVVEADGIGTYSVDGIVRNQGLRISKESMRRAVFENGMTLLDLCANEVPHVTLCVMNGGKAVDTSKCAFRDCVPFKIRLRIGVFADEPVF